MRELEELRYEPIEKRIRAKVAGVTVVDTTRAMLVWEPKRVVPTYGIPIADIAAEVVAGEHDAAGDATSAGALPMGAPPELAGRRVYDPSVPFAVRATDGEPMTIRIPAADREAAAFRAADEALADYLIVDFDGFDEWYEEDERNVGHPRDPFHRIDIVHSSRHVRVELDGAVLAESSKPYLLFEPPIPPRYYLPHEDVRLDLLQPSDSKSFCAYKGEASYFAFDGDDIAWTYPQPLREAAEVTDRVAFFNEHVDLVVDGERLERPVTPWSHRGH